MSRRHPPKSRAGEQVLDGRYRLDKLLGAGGMGAVYVATHKWSGRRVALKIVPCDLGREEAIESALVDARAPVMINHPNVVQVLDAGCDPAAGEVYIATELLDGHDLRTELCEVGRMSASALAKIVLPVMDALSAAHAAGVVHRDIKAENLLISRTYGKVRPVLIDFGIARADSLRRLTAPGAAVGTPVYMAPEQIRADGAVGPAADVWAMGVLLYECLTGELPYDAPSNVGVASKILCAEAPPEVPPVVPDAIAAVIRRALEPDPARRWPSMTAMRDAWLDATGFAVQESSSLRTLPMSIAPTAPINAAAVAQTEHDPSHVAPVTLPRAQATRVRTTGVLMLLVAGVVAMVGVSLRRPERSNATPRAATRVPASGVAAGTAAVDGDHAHPGLRAPIPVAPTPTVAVSPTAPEAPRAAAPRARIARAASRSTRVNSADAGSPTRPRIPTELLDPWEQNQ